MRISTDLHVSSQVEGGYCKLIWCMLIWDCNVVIYVSGIVKRDINNGGLEKLPKRLSGSYQVSVNGTDVTGFEVFRKIIFKWKKTLSLRFL